MATTATTAADNVRKFTKKQIRNVSKLGFDWNLVLVLLFLLGFGLIMVYSASSFVAVRDFGNPTHYFSKQAIADLIGIAGAAVVMFIPYKIYNKHWIFPWIFYGIAVVMPLLTIPFGVSSHNASRWIEIGSTGFNVQPAEISKIAMIFFMAAWLQGHKKTLSTLKIFLLTLAFPLLPSGLVLFVTDNLSTAIIIYGICFLMAFLVSRDYAKYLIALAIVGVIAVIVIVYVGNADISGEGFRLARIYSWLHPENSSDDNAHQVLQSMYAIGNGGVWGRGLGQSIQKISNLPEPHNDFIFSIICEELGIVGAITVIILFILLISRIYMIARDTQDTYGYLLVVGVMSHIMIQVVMHIAVATNSMPNTGVSFPFISYGGTSACFLLAEMGLVFSVNRGNRAEVRK